MRTSSVMAAMLTLMMVDPAAAQPRDVWAGYATRDIRELREQVISERDGGDRRREASRLSSWENSDPPQPTPRIAATPDLSPERPAAATRVWPKEGLPGTAAQRAEWLARRFMTRS